MPKSATTITVVFNIPFNPSTDGFWTQDVLAALKLIKDTGLPILDAKLNLPDEVFSSLDDDR